ncbi:helicase associated domain-containing protein [Brachybacterium sp. JHP9]|uniref:Helicase associated domain-containing protein n=1 Tax=Brachybacterium equifaecis TaxID=2910770 RepID=A0ABT0R369_9MICO|nr:helicase associated domain-containing protein [Brachybacterium equifaecis]MCL6424379.1 helicase associated domain-containing protein [Brachybacterium equifaecis]
MSETVRSGRPGLDMLGSIPDVLAVSATRAEGRSRSAAVRKELRQAPLGIGPQSNPYTAFKPRRRPVIASPEVPWGAYMKAVSKHVAQHGGLPTLGDNAVLAAWLTRQREARENGDLTFKQARSLNEHAPGWQNPPATDGKDRRPLEEKMRQHLSAARASSTRASWLGSQRVFDSALEGWRATVQDRACTEWIGRFDQWLATQREALQIGLLPRHRGLALDRVSPSWRHESELWFHDHLIRYLAWIRRERTLPTRAMDDAEARELSLFLAAMRRCDVKGWMPEAWGLQLDVHLPLWREERFRVFVRDIAKALDHEDYPWPLAPGEKA